jgi:hypothetical protein
LKRQLRAAAVAAAALLPLAASAQQPSVPLTSVAQQLGFHYAYLGPDEAVALSRPGIVVILRPGEPLYELNDRSIPIDGPSPSYKGGEVFISRTLFATLRRLAATSAPATAVDLTPRQLSQMAGPKGPVTIDALTATHIEGDQALHVAGQATPLADITLTLIARLSSGIPDVVVSRSHVSADKNGVFTGRVAIAPVFFAGSLFKVVAASDSDSTRSVTTTVTDEPNGNTQVPSEVLPRAVR